MATFPTQSRTLLLVLFFVLNAFYFFLIFGTLSIPFCCDAVLYLRGGKALFSEGLLFDHAYGYRSVFNYGFAQLIETGGTLIGAQTLPRLPASPAYVVGALFVYASVGAALILSLSEKSGFLPIFAAVFLNPITMAYVPYPIQESQMAILLGPALVVTYVTIRGGACRASVILLWVFAALAWMVKGAFLLIALPIFGLAVFMSWREQRWGPSAIGALLAIIIIAPQSYVVWQRSGAIYPYPDTASFEQQIGWGYANWRTETVLAKAPAEWANRLKPTGFAPIQHPAEYLSRLAERPMDVAALWLGHVVGAFDYSLLKPYIIEGRTTFLSPFNIFVGVVLALGLLRWIAVMTSGYKREDFFVDAIMLGSAAALPLLAVETRYSYLATVILTMRAGQWAGAKNDEKAPALFVALAFALVFTLAISLMNSVR